MKLHMHSLSDRILVKGDPNSEKSLNMKNSVNLKATNNLLGKFMRNNLISSRQNHNSKTKQKITVCKTLEKYKNLLSDYNIELAQIKPKNLNSNTIISSRNHTEPQNNKKKIDNLMKTSRDTGISFRMKMRGRNVSELLKESSKSTIHKAEQYLKEVDSPKLLLNSTFRNFISTSENEMLNFMKKISEIDLIDNYSGCVHELITLLEKISEKIPEFRIFILTLAKAIHLFHETSVKEVNNLMSQINQQEIYISSLQSVEEENDLLLAKLSQIGKQVKMIKEFNIVSKDFEVKEDLNIKEIIKENKNLKRELKEVENRVEELSMKEMKLMKFYSTLRSQISDFDNLFEKEDFFGKIRNKFRFIQS